MKSIDVTSKSDILEKLLQTTHEGYWFIDNDAVTLDVNPAMCEILARPREEIMGRKIFDFVDEESAEIFHRQIALRHHGKKGSYEIALRRPDGTNVPCVNNATPVYDESGRKVASIGLWIDISEIKRAETALQAAHDELDRRVQERTAELAIANEDLRRSEAQLRLVTDNLPALIAYIDRGLIIRFANKPYAEYSGLPLESVVGKHLRDIRGQAAFEESLPHSTRALAGEVASNEGVRQAADGSHRYFHATRVPHFGDDGQVQGYFIIFLDMTKHKEQEEQLRQAQKMQAVGHLTGGVAHDFNNLLTIIQGNLELITQHVDDQTGTQLVETAINASQRGAELTQRLLAYGRRQPLRAVPVELGAQVGGMRDLLARTLGETVEVSFSAPDDLWPALADQGQVESALLNLAINSRDAMPAGGKLIIECDNLRLDEALVSKNPGTDTGDYVVLAVSDTGMGMSPDVMKQAFEPFFTTKEVGKGSGLGLSMIYGFAKQSGEFVTIHSEEGRGTTVKLYLPRSDAAVPNITNGDGHDLPANENKAILVIEDDQDLRELVVKILKSRGYSVRAVAGAAAARDVLNRGNPPDLVLSDVVLPGSVSGPEFIEEMHQTYPRIRTVFMSGYPAEIVDKTARLGADAVLINKPFKIQELAKAVREALE